ncbi:MAG: glycosyl hydrolase, partial [Capsulimonadales bacterium]|nr:glycosyl hydrolase [Capsulimonadales bacterium]
MKTVSAAKPWTRWWWLGNALTEPEITRCLTLFKEAGFGGVEVSPIYGVRGSEGRQVAFLSPRWIELFAFTLREAHRLGLGVDLIAGTGWPFGGPWVGPGDAAQKLPPDTFLRPDAMDGVASLSCEPTGQQVKRAAPGGEGNVLDHFSAAAARRYFEPLSDALCALPAGLRPRCFFNDSFEVYGANATPELRREFLARRGYDLLAYRRAFQGDDVPDIVQRVRSDYRETIGDLLHDGFLKTFRRWAHAFRDGSIRNQAHGSPGPLLDLYAASDIPETEVFGSARFSHAGLSPLRPALPDFGRQEERLVCRMASSAAHVACRPLCSSESFTWLGEHGCIPLEHMKAEADLLLTLGINHLFFHGTPYSPEDVPWPGWLFYATTHCGATNPWWPHLPTLNAYITRCQTELQAGHPDNDLLFYFPYYDLLASEVGARDGLQYSDVHRTGE